MKQTYPEAVRENRVLERYDRWCVIVILGRNGMACGERYGPVWHLPAPFVEVWEVNGAEGDGDGRTGCGNDHQEDVTSRLQICVKCRHLCRSGGPTYDALVWEQLDHGCRDTPSLSRSQGGTFRPRNEEASMVIAGVTQIVYFSNIREKRIGSSVIFSGVSWLLLISSWGCGRDPARATALSPASAASASAPNTADAMPSSEVPREMRGSWRLVASGDGNHRSRTVLLDLESGETPHQPRLTIDATSLLWNDAREMSVWECLALRVDEPHNVVRFVAKVSSADGASPGEAEGSMRWEGERLVVTLRRASQEITYLLERDAPRTTTVFIVHGTYDATSDWCRELPGTVTFASALKSAIGANTTNVEPVLWRSSIDHDVRMTASADLARLIDDSRFDGTRIILVGHSHGGNVCLAAAGKCQREVDVVVCLATPHIHLLARDDQHRLLSLPVYCSPIGRRNVHRLISVSLSGDPVVGTWAALRKGVDEQAAVRETYEWRRALNHPRLKYDSGPVKELLEDLLEEKLDTNLIVGPELGIADYQLTVACDLTDTRAHSVVHSCRMGELLGGILLDGLSSDAVDYLASTVLPSDSDQGGPLDKDSFADWRTRHRAQMRFSGWVLSSLDVESTKKTKPNGKNWDVDGSWPDLCVQASCSTRKLGETVVKVDAKEMHWQPHFHFPDGSHEWALRVLDRDLAQHDAMGTVALSGTQVTFPSSSHACSEFTIKLQWKRGHY